MKTILHTVYLTTFALLFVGCSAVGVRTSMGPPESVFEPEQLEGDWLFYGTDEDAEKVPYQIKRLPDNTIRFATMEWDDENNVHKAVESEAQFLKINGEPFIQVKDNSKEDMYHFYRVEVESEGKATIHPPSLEPFVKAVETGALAGRIMRLDDGKRVSSVILADGLELRNYLEGESPSSLFPQGPGDVIATRVK